MGKGDKKHKHRNRQRGTRHYTEEEGEIYYDELQCNPQHSSSLSDDDNRQEEGEEDGENDDNLSKDLPSKFLLYQQSVQV